MLKKTGGPQRDAKEKKLKETERVPKEALKKKENPPLSMGSVARF